LRMVKLVEKYADYVINHPPTSLFHKKPFIAWLNIGFPFDIAELPNLPVIVNSAKIKILHAPSNFVGKGSQAIIDTINKLKEKAYPLELVIMKGVPNHKVLAELLKCDLVIDELYSDISLGGLGVEAAFAKKPVINCGYYAEYIEHEFSENLLPPSVFCLPHELEGAIIKTVTAGSSQCVTQGLKLYSFVNNHWECSMIAKKYLNFFEDTVPDDWYFEPQKLKYYLGYGISREKLKVFLAEYIARYGEDSLFINDKPDLKNKLLAFAKS